MPIWKKGYVVKFPIVDGDGRTPAQIKFAGRETIKADNGVKKRSTDGPPSERITRRLRGGFGMDMWKVALEPEG